jgi:hypothetical protein
MRSAGNAARMAEKGNADKILVEKLKGRIHSVEKGLDGKILSCILRK